MEAPSTRLALLSKPHMALTAFLAAWSINSLTLHKYRCIPKLAIQQDAPRLPLFRGTFAMSTTLHVLLETQHPTNYPPLCITRDAL
jgi:hypothetical protein